MLMDLLHIRNRPLKMKYSSILSLSKSIEGWWEWWGDRGWLYCIYSCWFAVFLFLFLEIITSPWCPFLSVILCVVPFRRMHELLYYFCTDVLYCTILFCTVQYGAIMCCVVSDYLFSTILWFAHRPWLHLHPHSINLSITRTHFHFMYTNHTHLLCTHTYTLTPTRKPSAHLHTFSLTDTIPYKARTHKHTQSPNLSHSLACI